MRWRALLLASALGLIAGLIIFMPAAVLESPANQVLAQQLPLAGPVRISGLNGTIWSGSGQLQMAGQQLALDWQFKPATLLRLSLGWQVKIEGAALQGRALVSKTFRAVELGAVQLRAPVAVAAPLISPLLGVANPQGVAIVKADYLQFAAQGMTGKAELNWQDAALTWLPDNQGSYTMQMVGSGDKVQFTLATRQARLQVAGEGSWSAQAGMQFTGVATPPQPAPSELLAVLATAGKALPDGRYQIDYRALSAR